MSDKVILAKKDQAPPAGYKRVSAPPTWKTKSQFDVKLDSNCPSCWGSGVQRYVPDRLTGDKRPSRERTCDCLLSAVLRYLERLNRGPAKAPASAQAASKSTPLSESARAAITRAEAELDALDEQRAVALERLHFAVTGAIEETEVAQARYDAVEDSRAAAVETANDLREQAAEYRRRADVVDENRIMIEDLAARFAREQIPLQAQVEACKRRQSKLSVDVAHVTDRWARRMKGPQNRLERLRRRAGGGVEPFPFKLTVNPAEQVDEEAAAGTSTVDALDGGVES